MQRRQFLIVAVGALIAGIGSAVAQDPGWNGTWSGTTARGGSVLIVISGNRPVQYVFRGENASIGASQISGDTMTFAVGRIGRVSLRRQGNRASYAYTDTRGNNAQAVLSRR